MIKNFHRGLPAIHKIHVTNKIPAKTTKSLLQNTKSLKSNAFF